MQTAAVIGGLVVLFAGRLAYALWLKKGFRPRTVTTTLPMDHVRQIFQAKVARAGWTIVEYDNPMVAESSLIAGRRQQIALEITNQPNGRTLTITVPQSSTKGGIPVKGHTLRMRMNSFLSEVQSADGGAVVTG